MTTRTMLAGLIAMVLGGCAGSGAAGDARGLEAPAQDAASDEASTPAVDGAPALPDAGAMLGEAGGEPGETTAPARDGGNLEASDDAATDAGAEAPTHESGEDAAPPTVDAGDVADVSAPAIDAGPANTCAFASGVTLQCVHGDEFGFFANGAFEPCGLFGPPHCPPGFGPCYAQGATSVNEPEGHCLAEDDPGSEAGTSSADAASEASPPGPAVTCTVVGPRADGGTYTEVGSCSAGAGFVFVPNGGTVGRDFIPCTQYQYQCPPPGTATCYVGNVGGTCSVP